MEIQKNHVVSIFYQLSDDAGNALESNDNEVPMAYLHGANNLLPGLEAALEGKREGDTLEVVLPPEQAYGPIKPNAVSRVPIKHLLGKHKRLMPGMFVKVQTDKGVVNGRIVKSGKFMVDVDFNHPFAGKTLTFNVRIDQIRPATEEELAHGHAHGEGGHHH